jgi:hypothetical protein
LSHRIIATNIQKVLQNNSVQTDDSDIFLQHIKVSISII